LKKDYELRIVHRKEKWSKRGKSKKATLKKIEKKKH